MPSSQKKSSPVDETCTRERILAAAAPLFAREGFEATGVRAIAAAGGVNIAAVNYHFGSKDALIIAIAERHTRLVNERRLEVLATVLDEARAAGRPPEVRAIVDAFVAPAIRFLMTEDRENFLLMRLILIRVKHEAKNAGRVVIVEAMRPTLAAFVDALKLAVPGATEKALHEGLHITIGAFVQSMTCDDLLLQICPGVDRDPETVIRHLVAYCSDGILALARA